MIYSNEIVSIKNWSEIMTNEKSNIDLESNSSILLEIQEFDDNQNKAC